MARRTASSLAAAALLAALAVLASLPASRAVAVGWIPARPNCSGSMAECLDGAEEFVFDSEVTRRILQTQKYISYGALKRDTVPCSVRGASYYNCRPGAQANPYRRPCSKIALCRS